MSVFREATIEWKGKEYTFVPSMRLIRSIEQEGISLIYVHHQALIGKPQTSLMGLIMYRVMLAAGVDVTEEEIHQAFSGASVSETNALYIEIMEALTPIQEKKDETPSE